MSAEGILLMIAVYLLAIGSIIKVHWREFSRQDDTFGACLCMLYRAILTLFVLYYAWVGIKASLECF